MATLDLRLPVRLKEKLTRISGGKPADWIREQIEKARANET